MYVFFTCKTAVSSFFIIKLMTGKRQLIARSFNGTCVEERTKLVIRSKVD